MAVVAAQCSGWLSVDPRYCVTPDATGERFYCEASGIAIGDVVPLRLRVQNVANFDLDEVTTYVPGTSARVRRQSVCRACATVLVHGASALLV